MHGVQTIFITVKCGTFRRILQNAHLWSKPRPIALQRISYWSAFVHLFSSASKNWIPVFSCFSWFL